MSQTAALPVLLLVDGSSYLYRAYHAMPNLSAPDGFPTGAIHGIIAMLKKLRSDIGAEHAACVFDAKGKTFRDDWYPAYKATRSPMPDDLRRQIEPIHEAVRLLGWPVLALPGIEADDAIGTLARRAAESGHRVVISTGDKDLAQLVNERVSLINTMSNEALDVAGVQAKFGVPPERIVDYLALVGDTVDNVPGVDKVGPKTAVKWLAEHGSLDGVVAAADKIGGAVGENLRKALDWLPMAKKLVTVVTDCDLSAQVPGWPALDSLALAEVDRAALLDFYNRYGFRAFKRELEPAGDAVRSEVSKDPHPARPQPGHPFVLRLSKEGLDPSFDRLRMNGDASSGRTEMVALARSYETILTQERLDHWLAKLRAAPLVALDTETTSLDAMAARIVGISFAVVPGEAAYVPLAHNYGDAPTQLPLDAVLANAFSSQVCTTSAWSRTRCVYFSSTWVSATKLALRFEVHPSGRRSTSFWSARSKFSSRRRARCSGVSFAAPSTTTSSPVAARRPFVRDRSLNDFRHCTNSGAALSQ